MPADPPRHDAHFETVKLSALGRHDALCDEFSCAWRGGRRPLIEEWLNRVPDEERGALFYNLAKLERELRDGEDVTDEFRRRFGYLGGWVESVLRSRDGEFDPVVFRPQPLPEVPGYAVLDRIALGGMGVVYKAVQLSLRRTVALKMVRGGRWGQGEELARFVREAQAVADFNHPNVVQIIEYNENGGLPYFSMEYVEGGSLSQRLIADPPDFRTAAALLETVARAVHACHKRNIVHRDLKPGNILLTKDGVPKISDFGLAKRMGGGADLTVAGMVMGTASYMAPEQARGEGEKVGPHTDVWALGVILYEMLTGGPPFRAGEHEATIRRLLDEEPRRPREIAALVPAELEAVCLKCLEKDPRQRYASAAELADDLRRFLDGEDVTAGPYEVIDQHERWARRVGYEQLELAGVLPWAHVYRARETRIDRRVALVVCTGRPASPEHARLHRQAEAMAGPGHPNVEQIYVYGEQYGRPYLVRELIDGHSFSAVLHERAGERPSAVGDDPSGAVSTHRLPPRQPFTPLTPENAAGYVRDLARALQYVHGNGVLHSGIYPGEVRLTRDGVVKLCGFGAAQKLVADALPREAQAEWVRLNYQPPEQAAGRWEELCPASDVYMLGALLYELVAGRVPFFGHDGEALRRAVLEGVPVAPRNLNGDVAVALDAICQRCLAKAPADRFPTASELAEELDRYLHADDQGGTISMGGGRVAESRAPGDFELHVTFQDPQRTIALPLSRNVVEIGRALESDVRVRDQRCGSNHCAIYWDDDTSQYVLLVRKAKNGVKVNKIEVPGRQALAAGDEITVPGARLLFVRKLN
jgi:serine/threonine protein kinase